MKLLLKLIMFLIPMQANAESFYSYLNKKDFLKLDEIYVEYRQYEAYRNPYYLNKQDWVDTAEFHWNLSVYDRFYWHNNFHMSTDKTPQVRHGGWEFYIGLKVLDWFHVVKYHHSEHSFEEKQQQKFPVEDSYGVRIYIKK